MLQFTEVKIHPFYCKAQQRLKSSHKNSHRNYTNRMFYKKYPQIDRSTFASYGTHATTYFESLWIFTVRDAGRRGNRITEITRKRRLIVRGQSTVWWQGENLLKTSVFSVFNWLIINVTFGVEPPLRERVGVEGIFPAMSEMELTSIQFNSIQFYSHFYKILTLYIVG